MRVVVTGSTGTIGRAVVGALRSRGDHVVALTRDPHRAPAPDGVEIHAWPHPKEAPPPRKALVDADAIVHPMGDPVAQRWTDDAKREIRDSRVLSTRSLVAGIKAIRPDQRTLTLISQSATGFYGPRGDEWVDEDAAAGDDFLAQVVVEWEREALAAADLQGVRVAVSRTGVVLSDGGALSKMLPPFRMGVGGTVAGGRRYVPWVHLDDVVGALLRCLDDGRATGAVNVVAPNPVTNAELSRTLGRVRHRPARIAVPGLVLQAMYGEMAVMVIGGQRVSVERLMRLGYAFRYARLEPALRELLGSTR